jgi:hypothetical protein
MRVCKKEVVVLCTGGSGYMRLKGTGRSLKLGKCSVLTDSEL